MFPCQSRSDHLQINIQPWKIFHQYSHSAGRRRVMSGWKAAEVWEQELLAASCLDHPGDRNAHRAGRHSSTSSTGNVSRRDVTFGSGKTWLGREIFLFYAGRSCIWIKHRALVIHALMVALIQRQNLDFRGWPTKQQECCGNPVFDSGWSLGAKSKGISRHSVGLVWNRQLHF